MKVKLLLLIIFCVGFIGVSNANECSRGAIAFDNSVAKVEQPVPQQTRPQHRRHVVHHRRHHVVHHRRH